MKRTAIFFLIIFCFQAQARTCDCLNKIHFLSIVADAELEQAYYREAHDIAYYHGRVDAMSTAYFQVFQSTDNCRCYQIVAKLSQKAEDSLDQAEKYSHWPGDTWYWLGVCNAYADILKSLCSPLLLTNKVTGETSVR